MKVLLFPMILLPNTLSLFDYYPSVPQFVLLLWTNAMVEEKKDEEKKECKKTTGCSDVR
jgi:hypothetical protein